LECDSSRGSGGADPPLGSHLRSAGCGGGLWAVAAWGTSFPSGACSIVRRVPGWPMGLRPYTHTRHPRRRQPCSWPSRRRGGGRAARVAWAAWRRRRLPLVRFFGYTRCRVGRCGAGAHARPDACAGSKASAHLCAPPLGPAAGGGPWRGRLGGRGPRRGLTARGHGGRR
jgi:hypothetical protein